MHIVGTAGIDKDAIELGIFPINQMDYTDYYPPSFFDNYTSKQRLIKSVENGIESVQNGVVFAVQ